MFEIVKGDSYEEITQSLAHTDNYCVCIPSYLWNEDYKCICKAFLEQKEEGHCHCRRYKKVKENN